MATCPGAEIRTYYEQTGKTPWIGYTWDAGQILSEDFSGVISARLGAEGWQVVERRYVRGAKETRDKMLIQLGQGEDMERHAKLSAFQICEMRR